jgi:hypothetical protein
MVHGPSRRTSEPGLPRLLHARREIFANRTAERGSSDSTLVVIATGVCTVLHIGKRPPAITQSAGQRYRLPVNVAMPGFERRGHLQNGL